MAVYDYTSGGFPASPASGDTLAMKGTTYSYNGSAWEVQTGGTTSFTYTATSGQTAFTGADTGSKTLAYTAASIHVFLNGVLLDAADYTATDGTTITLAVGATTGDTLQIVAYGVLVAAASGGGGGWEEITTGTITSNVEFLDFTGISTDYKSIRLYFTEIQTSAAPNYQAIWASSTDSFASPLAWKQYTYGNDASNTTCVSGYGNPTTGKIYLTSSGYSATSTTSDYQQFTMMIQIHDIQDLPYLTVETFGPIGNVGKLGYSMAHGCADRIQSIRIGSGYSSRHYSAGTYKLYGMK